MRGQFRVQRTLQNRLGQLLQKTVLPGYLFHRRTPLQQLIDQLPIQSHSISSQLVEKIVYTIWFTPSPKTVWVSHLRRGFMRLRWECIPSPSQLLFLRLLVPFQPPLTNVISTEGGAL